MVVIVQENQLRTISSRVCVPLELAAPILRSSPKASHYNIQAVNWSNKIPPTGVGVASENGI
jgi:hypothetical protein